MSLRQWDVIVGNPPYQTKSDKEDDKTQAIWHKFVEKSFEVVKENGYVCLIHPSGWRDIDGMFKNTQKLLKSKDIKYLEVHDRDDGVKTFNVQTSYDWHITKNAVYSGNTEILGYENTKEIVDISDMEFIPNGIFHEISQLIAKEGEEKVSFARDASNFHTQKEWMSKDKDNEFRYPCVYVTLKNGEISLWYSKFNNKGHFGVPKVIFSNGTSSPVIDIEGEYGLTQFSYAIIDSKENLKNIQKALNNENFIKIMDRCQLVGKHRYHYKIIASFRKDFWKEFV